ncbi:alpha/beta fold hydrolase [Thalassobaculum sp.]|uniref:alpha/beta fold hydrolase n=1 Tax=Thalassobaculum sp. TaxID=2022740 RepID=UPI0032EFDCAB
MAGRGSSVSANDGPPRPGPRPLPLYLTTAATTWLSSYASSAAWKQGSLDWKPGSKEAASSLRDQLAALEAARAAAEADPGAGASPGTSFEQAMDEEVRRRFGRFLDGIEVYRSHPYRRPADHPPVCWKEGATLLLDYGAVPEAASGPGGGLPVLVVPSLVNRGYVLDLTPQRSLMRGLAAAGFRPFLVEWGFPGEAERRFTLTDYVAGRLEGALEAVLTITGRRPPVLGYCMGGLLALALVQRRPRDTAGLALLATPWDFAADAPPVAAALPLAEPWLTAMIEAAGWLPTDLIQTLFFSLDPMLVIRKFLRFSELDPGGPEAAEFVALEDWLNDGVPLAAPVAREALFDWYGRNTPAEGEWRVAGRAITPERIDAPALVMIPARDRIVPPASARDLARRLPNAIQADVALGHIGMVVGSSAPKRAWSTLIDWLNDIPETASA